MPDRAKSPGRPLEGCPFFLSWRQRQVLTFAAQGLTDVAIAQRLSRSPRTVRMHLQMARSALGALNTCHAVAIAVAWRLIDVDNFLIGEINCSSPAA